jgi:hypothetical protein
MLAGLVAIISGALFAQPNLKIKWQYDNYRDIIKEREIRRNEAIEFNKTNTNLGLAYWVKGNLIQWTPKKGEIE